MTMTRLLLIGILALGACGKGKKSPNAAGGVEYDPSRPGHPDLRCPPETRPTGYPPPVSHEVWCSKTLPSGRPVRHGPVIQWRPEGALRATGMFYEDRKQGTWFVYYPDGTLERTETWDAGRLEGPYVEYHHDGAIKAEGMMANGREQGGWTYWTDDGKMEKEGPYEDGELHGTWIFYDELGEPDTRRIFRYGALKSQQEL